MMRRGWSSRCAPLTAAKVIYDLTVAFSPSALHYLWQYFKDNKLEMSDARPSAASDKRPTPYDFIVDVQSVEALCASPGNAWSVWVVPKYLQYLNQRKTNTNEEPKLSVVACLGYYSKGKSTILNLIHAAYHKQVMGDAAPPLSLDVGSGVTTLGLSGKFVGHKTIEQCPVLFLDVAGRNAPAKQFHYDPQQSSASVEEAFLNSKRAVSDMRAREHVTDRAAFHVCDVMLYVVDEVLNEDQRFLLNYIYESRAQPGMRGKQVVIVHNLKRLTSPEVLKVKLAEAEAALTDLSQQRKATQQQAPSAWVPHWLLSADQKAALEELNQRVARARGDPVELRRVIDQLQAELKDTLACVGGQFAAFDCRPVKTTEVAQQQYRLCIDYVKQSSWPTKSGQPATITHVMMFNQSTSLHHNYLAAKWMSETCFRRDQLDTPHTAFNIAPSIAAIVSNYRNEVVMEVPNDQPVKQSTIEFRVPSIDDPPFDMQQLIRMPLTPTSQKSKYVPREFELLPMPSMSLGEVKAHNRREGLSIVLEAPGLPDKGFSVPWVDEVVATTRNGSWITWRVQLVGADVNRFATLDIKGYLRGARSGAFVERFVLPATAQLKKVTSEHGIVRFEIVERDESTFQPG